jgi:hypothetical protein
LIHEAGKNVKTSVDSPILVKNGAALLLKNFLLPLTAYFSNEGLRFLLPHHPSDKKT